uniref:Uncharacterized protein n=1 Tax=Sus scrofa TaxID=9823 RepID=A0A8D1DIA8_PIG
MSYQWYRFDPWPRNFICCRCSQKKPPKTINPTFLYSQARYESQRIQMESELAVQLEQRVTERLAQAQESSLRQAASLREHHRKQLQELSAQHQQELSTHLAQFKVEMAEREERQQQVAQDYELRYWIWSVAVCPQSQWEWRGAACFVDVAPAPFRISRLTCLSGSSCSPRLCFLKGSTSPLASLFQTGPGAGTSAGTAEWESAAGGAASGAGRATPGHAAGPLGGGKPAAQRHLPAAPPPGRPRP